MKRFAAVIAFVAVLIFSIHAVSVAGEGSSPSPQAAQKTEQVQKQDQNRPRQFLCDNDGDGICDYCGRAAGSGRGSASGRKAGRGKRCGPGDGTGNMGQGPKDGTGYGARSGKRMGPGCCRCAANCPQCPNRPRNRGCGFRGCCR